MNAKESRLAKNEVDLNLNLGGTQIKNTKEEQLLGLIIDTILTWHYQVNETNGVLGHLCAHIG